MGRRQLRQKHPDRLTEQPQAGQHRDVADHVRGIQPLPAHLGPQRRQDLVRGLRERYPRQIVFHQAGAEVVQRLLALSRAPDYAESARGIASRPGSRCPSRSMFAG
jgi:hypothetical protein